MGQIEMKNRYSYVLLETASLKKEFYYCLSNDTVYEAKTLYGKTHYPLLAFIICVPVGALLALVICALYSRTSSSTAWSYMGFSALFACIAICVNDYFKRQRQSDLIKSQKSLAYFCSYLPLIRRWYRTQKAAAVICLLMLVIFIFYIDDSPFLCLISSSLCAASLYFLIFRVGIFYKQKAIDLIQIIGKTDTVAKTQL